MLSEVYGSAEILVISAEVPIRGALLEVKLFCVLVNIIRFYCLS